MNTPKKNSQSLGQGMIFLAWILFLALLSYAFSHYLDRQNNPNQSIQSQRNGQTAEVKLQRNRYGHYLAAGKINQHSVTFLLDTGATLISIPSNIAKQLNLKSGYPIQSRTANGSITVYATRLDSVSIGAIQLNNIPATINPHMNGEEILLGMSFMKHLEITQKGNQLILRF